MSLMFVINTCYFKSSLAGQESFPQESRNILRCAQNDRFCLIDNFLYVIPHLMRNLFYYRDSRSYLPAGKIRGNDNPFYYRSESRIVGMKNLIIKNYKSLHFVQSVFKTPFYLIILLVFTSIYCTDAQVYSEEDIETCSSTFQFAVDENLQEKPINEVIVEVGKSFIGTDYVSHTLEVDGDERLVINLTGLDCNTFLEYALVFARNIKQGKTTFDDYKNELTLIRYRGGKIDRYPSRLHYFTDWIYDNSKKVVVEDITEKIGGEILKLDLSFMSTHPQYYKHLKENPEFIHLIKQQEAEISKRDYYFITREKIADIENKIENGDLLAFTSTVKGLDVNHVGIAVRLDDGRIHVLHAPNVGYQVEITKLPLAEYVMKIEKDSGIIVVRVLEPDE
jgi:hypothetical protein